MAVIPCPQNNNLIDNPKTQKHLFGLRFLYLAHRLEIVFLKIALVYIQTIDTLKNNDVHIEYIHICNTTV